MTDERDRPEVGQQFIFPLFHGKTGNSYVVVASKGGAPTNPDWYYNLRANPLVIVEAGTEQFQARAAVASEPERTRLYNKMIEMMPGFAEYPLKTTRVIPVFTLTPVK